MDFVSLALCIRNEVDLVPLALRVRNEVDLVPLACKDEEKYASGLKLMFFILMDYSIHIDTISMG